MAAQLGIDNRNGILLAAKHKGTILGQPIQIITEDDEGQSEAGIRKAEKLVFKDKVVALTGVTVANVGQAIAGEADPPQRPLPHHQRHDPRSSTACIRWFSAAARWPMTR